MVEQKFDPPPIFWAPDFTYIQIKTMIFQKKIIWLWEKTENVERRQSSVIIKIFLIRSFYFVEQKCRPPPRFLSSCFHLYSNYT